MTLTKGATTKTYKVGDKGVITYWKGSTKHEVMVGVRPSYVIRKSTKLQRGKLDARSGTMQKNYREALESRGFDWSGLDADHVLELGFKGRDRYTNLFPLDSAKNRWAYTGRWYTDYQIEYLKKGKGSKATAKRSTIYKMSGKWFQVKGFGQQPEKPGGRGKP